MVFSLYFVFNLNYRVYRWQCWGCMGHIKWVSAWRLFEYTINYVYHCTSNKYNNNQYNDYDDMWLLCGWPMIHMARFLWSFSSCCHIWDEWVNTFLCCCFDFHYKIKFIYLYLIIRKMEREKQSIFDNK